MPGIDDLRYYQLHFSDIVEDEPYVFLALDMGLGKSVTTLTAVRRLIRDRKINKVLIVAPLRVARDTWPTELKVWKHLRNLTYTLIRCDDDDPQVVRFMKRRRAAAYNVARDLFDMGPREAQRFATSVAQRAATELKIRVRESLAEEDTQIHIINREAVPWLVKYWGNDWPYDMLVYDEASRLKAGRKRTIRNKKTGKSNLSEFGALCRVRPRFKRVVELSGTPSPNGVHDLWGPIYVLDGGKRLGTSKKKFHDKWFDINEYTHKITPKEGARQEIMHGVKDIMFGLDASEYIDLPPVRYNNVYVDLPKDTMREYRRFERDLVSQMYDVEAKTQGILTNKLLQFANGSMYRNLDDGRRQLVHVHDEKLEALSSIIEEANGASILVAYSYKFDLERIRRRFQWAHVFDEEPNFVDMWNSGKIELGLAHPASIGHGLNLQYGGHIAVWYGLNWSLELYQQFNKRLPRPGQAHEHVTIHHIVARGTADESVLRVLSLRGAEQDDVSAAVRVRLSA